MKLEITSHLRLAGEEQIEERRGWTRRGQPTALARLRRLYKLFKGAVVWELFPMSFHWEDGPVRDEWSGRVRTEKVPIADKPLTFQAKLEDVRMEVTKRWQHGDHHRAWNSNAEEMIHDFAAPFDKCNEALLLSDTSLSLRGESSKVLMDMAMESGMQLSRDYEYLRSVGMYRVLSDELRLFLASKLGEWPSTEFDMVFSTIHNPRTYMKFTLDDLKG